MVRLQAIVRNGDNLQSLIRAAIKDGHIKTFALARVKGGVKIKHKKHQGTITLSQKDGLLLAMLSCKNKQREWQLLEAFVGRLAYHFKDEISAINMQFQSAE